MFSLLLMFVLLCFILIRVSTALFLRYKDLVYVQMQARRHERREADFSEQLLRVAWPVCFPAR